MAKRLIGPYEATAYGRLKMPTPMMLPITRAVDCGSPSLAVAMPGVLLGRTWTCVMAFSFGGGSSSAPLHDATIWPARPAQRRRSRRDR